MDEEIDVELRAQMGEDYELIIKMLKVMDGKSARDKKEAVRGMLEMAADEKQGIKVVGDRTV